MRVLLTVAILTLFVVAAGCGGSRPFDGPTVDKFDGRVVHDGKPVSFPADETVLLQLVHEKGQSFGIPLKPDGSFQIGWMPIGKHTALLKRERPGGKGGPRMYTVPGGLTIEQGKTDYTVELGKGWKP